MTFKDRTEGHDEYATPPSLWRPLSRAVDGFDLDPASGAESTPIAPERYTKEDDGLSKPWFGDVWLNPPFGDSPGPGPTKRDRWLTKARDEVNRPEVRTVTVLVPVDTSTSWFHKHVVDAPVLCFLGPGRFTFEGQDKGQASFASSVAVYGEPPEALVKTLTTKGAVFHGRAYHRRTVQARLDADP